MKLPFSPTDRPFAVRPVRRYRVARYPSHRDPDPTLEPAALPYPWKTTALAGLLGMVMPAVAEEAGPAAPQKLAADTMARLEQAVAAAMSAKVEGRANPFAQALGLSGLPARASMFGTGEPSYLEDQIALEVIRRVFKLEGYPVDKGRAADPARPFPVTGYDSTHKTGFTLANHQSLALDAYMPGIVQAINLDTLIAETFSEDEVGLARMRAVAKLRLPNCPKETLDKINKLKSPRAVVEEIKKEIEAASEAALSMKEIEALETEAAQGREFIAVVSAYDHRLMVSPYIEFKPAEGASGLPTDPSTITRDLPPEVALAKVMERLALAVREYIAWARRNGLQ